MRIAIVLAMMAGVGCGKSKHERCEAMTAHHEQISGRPMEPDLRTTFVEMCTQAATDDEIECQSNAKTQADLLRCVGGGPGN